MSGMQCPGDEDVLVAEALLGIADVPAHEPAERERDLHVDLRAWAARMAALTVVLEDVDELVDRVFDLFPVLEVAFEIAITRFDLRGSGNGHEFYLQRPGIYT